MYLMAGGKSYTVRSYGRFIYKRFLRIAPAFYVAVIVYALFVLKSYPSFPFFHQVFYHFLFLNNITGNTISGPFWSIATEWHFYMLLPLCLLLSKKIPLPKTLLILSCCSLVLFCFVNKGLLPYGSWEPQILVRFPEFAVGMYAAYVFKQGKSVTRLFKGVKGLFFAFLIMYIGRFLKYTPFLEFSGNARFFFKSIADTVMVIGFGIMLLHVITQASTFSEF
jgi:peptidoglycan/LPS O-acetylase OafA/YrhL